ncbi:DUF4931 domain-containing protein [Amycolatopsis sp. NPDC049868]|uniref:galactose-1-phosphate uridylyltransferase n=1 Tax=Amycolatopsis sp. NPDC049868 TaxID=3363934 RepID=UPI00379F2C28
MTTQRWHAGELRQDPLTGDWTVLAPGRADRPHGAEGPCPFCPGPGEDTPPETWRLHDPELDEWRVRSVPNRHPLSDRHEVIIESPRHDWDFPTATDTEVEAVLRAWQWRHLALRKNSAQVVVFRNHGVQAGCSRPHPHSQLVGLPVLSSAARRGLELSREHHRRGGRRYSDDQLDIALEMGTRVVLINPLCVALTPFAPVTAFETRIVPRVSRADFAVVPDTELAGVAQALRQVLRALHEALGDPAYNLVVETAPTGWEQAAFLSWSIRVLPRLEIAAGLELATGIPVVTTTPEHAASVLRDRISVHHRV